MPPNKFARPATKRLIKKRLPRRAARRPSAVAAKCKQILSQTYGERLKGVVLYGSMARRQPSPSSDVDLLVLLAPPVDYFAELKRLIDVLYPVQMESKRLISAKPVSIYDFEEGRLSLYRNAKKEGIAL